MSLLISSCQNIKLYAHIILFLIIPLLLTYSYLNSGFNVFRNERKEGVVDQYRTGFAIVKTDGGITGVYVQKTYKKGDKIVFYIYQKYSDNYPFISDNSSNPRRGDEIPALISIKISKIIIVSLIIYSCVARDINIIICLISYIFIVYLYLFVSSSINYSMVTDVSVVDAIVIEKDLSYGHTIFFEIAAKYKDHLVNIQVLDYDKYEFGDKIKCYLVTTNALFNNEFLTMKKYEKYEMHRY